MKILFFISQLEAGGAERVVVTLANHWADKNKDIAIYSYSKTPFYSVDPEVKLYYDDLLIESSHKGKALLNNYRRIRGLKKVIDKERPDVIITLLPQSNIIAGLTKKMFRLKIPLIVCERSNPERFPLNTYWNFLKKKAYEEANLLILQTEASKRCYESYHIATRTIPNPVGLPASVKRSYENEASFMAAGRLVDDKGFDMLIRAFAKVKGDWSLKIFGEGNKRNNLERLIRELGMENRISLKGTTKKIAEEYIHSGIFVLSSRYEGYPNVLCEAMAHGLPSIAFDCDFGPGEIIKHGETGLLVPAEHIDELAKSMEMLAHDRKMQEYLGTNAAKEMQKNNITDIASMWESAIYSVLN